MNKILFPKKLLHFIFLFSAIALFSSGSLPAQNAPSDMPREDRPLPPEEENLEDGYLINFPNVSIVEYIRFISQITKKNFIYDEADLDFSVTILSEEPTSIENIIAALVQILRINGLSLLEQGNNLIIHRNAEITQVPKVIGSPHGETGVVTRVFQLKNVDPGTIFDIVKQMISKDSVAAISKSTRHLIVTDVSRNIREIEKLLRDIDAPNIALDIGHYSANFTRLATLIDLSEKILNPIIGENPHVMVPHQSSNTIYIVSTPHLIERTLEIMKTLDSPSESEEELPPGHIDSTNFYIHKLQYHNGEDVVTSLQAIGSNLTSTEGTNSSLLTTIKSVQWLKSTNSLLFTGDKIAINKVRELVDNLDVPLRQVLIEMLVIDTTITNSLSYGVEWGANLNRDNFSSGASALGEVGSTGSPLISALSATPDATTLIGASGFNFSVIGRTLTQSGTTYNSLSAVVRAAQQDKDTNILLNPKIITQDTSPAEIFVGGTSAFQASQSVNDQGQIVTVNVEYREIGSLLKVTPILGPNNIVTLDIEQEISEDLDQAAAGATGSATTVQLGPVTNLSKTRTRVHVPDQHFLIISGMIRENKTKDNRKIPCLGSIPFVGDTLFGTKSDATSKRSLMIFLRPHIVGSPEEMTNLTDKQKHIFEKNMPKGHHLRDLKDTLDQFDY